jgi:hypothetical protein
MLTQATYEHVAAVSMEKMPASGYNSNYLKTTNRTRTPYAQAGQLAPNWKRRDNPYTNAVPVARNVMERTTNLDYNKHYLRTANTNVTPVPEPYSKVKAIALLHANGEGSAPQGATLDKVKLLNNMLASARPDKQDEIRKLIKRAQANPNDPVVENYLQEASDGEVAKAMRIQQAMQATATPDIPPEEQSQAFEIARNPVMTRGVREEAFAEGKYDAYDTPRQRAEELVEQLAESDPFTPPDTVMFGSPEDLETWLETPVSQATPRNLEGEFETPESMSDQQLDALTNRMNLEANIIAHSGSRRGGNPYVTTAQLKLIARTVDKERSRNINFQVPKDDLISQMVAVYPEEMSQLQGLQQKLTLTDIQTLFGKPPSSKKKSKKLRRGSRKRKKPKKD